MPAAEALGLVALFLPLGCFCFMQHAVLGQQVPNGASLIEIAAPECGALRCVRACVHDLRRCVRACVHGPLSHMCVWVHVLARKCRCLYVCARHLEALHRGASTPPKLDATRHLLLPVCECVCMHACVHACVRACLRICLGKGEPGPAHKRLMLLVFCLRYSVARSCLPEQQGNRCRIQKRSRSLCT